MRPSITLAGCVLATAPILATASFGDTPATLTFDRAFRDQLVRYATVERADGKSYDLYINTVGLDGWRASRELPSGAYLAIESFTSPGSKNATVRDVRDPVVARASDNDVHVSMKALAWSETGPMTSEGRIVGIPATGTWRMASYDPRTGAPTSVVAVASCHACHRDPRAEDFVLSGKFLDSFIATGEPAAVSVPCRARDICS